jgi:S1-C subfamily serine protease
MQNMKKNNKNQKGFIQIPLFIAIIAGVLILGTSGYFGVRQYKNYQSKQIEKERVAQEIQQKKDLEVEKLKQEVEVLKNKKPETITKEVPAPKTENDLPTIIKYWRPIIVYIECNFLSIGTTGGSGMAASIDGSIFSVLTNAHVVGGNVAPQSCKISFPDSVSAPLISTHNRLADSGKDVAIIDINNPDEHMKKVTAPFDNLKFCAQKPSLGDKIVILGYPGIGSQTDITATEGIISGYDGDYFITSAKVEHGNSGGAAILIKDNCYFGIPSYVQVGSIESMARIFDIKKL